MRVTNYKPLDTPTGFLVYRWDNMWQHPVAARAVCPDGVIRTVRLNQSADTFFSWPGRVTIKGKTVRVWVGTDDDGTMFARPCSR